MKKMTLTFLFMICFSFFLFHSGYSQSLSVGKVEIPEVEMRDGIFKDRKSIIEGLEWKLKQLAEEINQAGPDYSKIMVLQTHLYKMMHADVSDGMNLKTAYVQSFNMFAQESFQPEWFYLRKAILDEFNQTIFY